MRVYFFKAPVAWPNWGQLLISIIGRSFYNHVGVGWPEKNIMLIVGWDKYRTIKASFMERNQPWLDGWFDIDGGQPLDCLRLLVKYRNKGPGKKASWARLFSLGRARCGGCVAATIEILERAGIECNPNTITPAGLKRDLEKRGHEYTRNPNI